MFFRSFAKFPALFFFVLMALSASNLTNGSLKVKIGYDIISPANRQLQLWGKKMKLYEVINTIQTWIKTVQEMYCDEINIEFCTEHKDCLRYFLESTNYLAKLVVESEGFHPYRFVSFLALDKRKGTLQKPYFYYDEENSSMESILENLNTGISYIMERS